MTAQEEEVSLLKRGRGRNVPWRGRRHSSSPSSKSVSFCFSAFLPRGLSACPCSSPKSTLPIWEFCVSCSATLFPEKSSLSILSVRFFFGLKEELKTERVDQEKKRLLGRLSNAGRLPRVHFVMAGEVHLCPTQAFPPTGQVPSIHMNKCYFGTLEGWGWRMFA